MTGDLCWQPYKSMSHQNDRNEHYHMSLPLNLEQDTGRCVLYALHPSKPQRPNKTSSSKTQVWLWKISALHSSWWGVYEMNSSNALIVSSFFPKLTKIHYCVNCWRKYSISVYEFSWVHLVTLVNVEISFTYQQSSTMLHLHG